MEKQPFDELFDELFRENSTCFIHIIENLWVHKCIILGQTNHKSYNSVNKRIIFLSLPKIYMLAFASTCTIPHCSEKHFCKRQIANKVPFYGCCIFFQLVQYFIASAYSTTSKKEHLSQISRNAPFFYLHGKSTQFLRTCQP